MSAPAYRLAAAPPSALRLRSVDPPARWHATRAEGEDFRRALCGAVARRLDLPFDPAAPSACPECRRLAEEAA